MQLSCESILQLVLRVALDEQTCTFDAHHAQNLIKHTEKIVRHIPKKSPTAATPTAVQLQLFVRAVTSRLLVHVHVDKLTWNHVLFTHMCFDT
jgi:hypothetical protein